MMPNVPSDAADQSRAGRSCPIRSTRSLPDIGNRPVGQNHLQPEHVIGGDEILEGVDSAGVGRGVSADGAGRWLDGSGAK